MPFHTTTNPAIHITMTIAHMIIGASSPVFTFLSLCLVVFSDAFSSTSFSVMLSELFIDDVSSSVDVSSGTITLVVSSVVVSSVDSSYEWYLIKSEFIYLTFPALSVIFTYITVSLLMLMSIALSDLYSFHSNLEFCTSFSVSYASLSLIAYSIFETPLRLSAEVIVILFVLL